MCGIVGIVDFREAVAPATLAAMRDALVHRGPDDAGLWHARVGPVSIGLGHRRLAILDLSPAGRQPMSSADGRVTVVFNGEIYNYRELGDELVSHGHRLRGACDTEVLLAAYQQWGPGCVERFNGMWAFALWDDARRRFFACRDRLGKKPLFYSWDGRRLVFASEMKALFRHPHVGCRPHAATLRAFVRAPRFDYATQTLFDGVVQLPPAHHLLLSDRAELRVERYWQPQAEATPRLASDDEYRERFRELFDDAVRLRLRADVRVGSSLSGGLDSSLIVGTTARLLGHTAAADPPHTFTARYPQSPTFDEGPFVDAVVQHTGATPHAITPRADQLLEALRDLHYHQEEPFLSTSVFAQWQVMRLAREQGTTVLLDGQGSDELLAGYLPHLGPFLADLLVGGRWWRAWREYRAFRGRQAEVRRLYTDAAMRTPQHSWGAALAKGLNWLGASLGRGAAATLAGGELLQRRLQADLTSRSIPLLLRYADRNSMAFGIEVRNPFLDYRLVEFLLGVPANLKIRDGWTKWLLRAAGAGTLPERVRWRADKVGFVTPEDQWLRGELRSWAARTLFGPRLKGLPGYPLDRIVRHWHEHQSARANRRTSLWPWLSLHEWLRMIDEGAFSARHATPAPHFRPRSPGSEGRTGAGQQATGQTS